MSISYTSFSQIDTITVLKNVNLLNINCINGFIEFVQNGNIENNDFSIKKKLWFVKENTSGSLSLISLRVENYNSESNELESIVIINDKEKLYINPKMKRCDLYRFKLMNDELLENFYFQAEEEFFPDFMINEGDNDLIINDFMKELRKKENIFFEILNDTIINSIPCIGFKIIDYDKNNGYLPDKSGRGNDRYADKTIEYNYISKKTNEVVLKRKIYYYKNPNSEKNISIKVIDFKCNDKDNTNYHLYSIKTDSLKNYFKTISRFNGYEIETELADFSLNKAPDFDGKLLNNDSFELNKLKSKVILIGFWSTDCDDCIRQMNALNMQYQDLKKSGFSYIAVNANEINDASMIEFLKDKDFKFDVVFSKKAADIYLIDRKAFYILLDEKLKIKEIFHELNQEILDKIEKKLK